MRSVHLKKHFFILLALLFLGMVCFQFFQEKTKTDPLFWLSEIQTAGANARNGVLNLSKKYLFLLNRYEENKKLSEENKKLHTRLQLFEEILTENERLKKLFQFSSDKAFRLLPAQITGTDFFSKNELLFINKGQAQGLQKFMGVLHPTGVVGHIFRVSRNSAQVITLRNPLSSLPARNRNYRGKGLVSAGRSPLLVLSSIDGPYFQKGDAIVTIKSDEFPGGFLVGTVLSLESSPHNLNPKAYIQPAVHFDSLEEVLVVLPSLPPSEKSETKATVKQEKEEL